MSQYFSKPYEPFSGEDINVKVELSNCATKRVYQVLKRGIVQVLR